MTSRVTLRYGPLRAALFKMFDVGTAAQDAFEARIKNLKRAGFPMAVRRDGGGRVDYRAIDFAALTVALRLGQLYVPPAAAARLVSAGLPQVAATSADGLSIVASDSPSGASLRSVIMFEPHALAALGTMAPRAGRYDAPVKEASIHLVGRAASGAGFLSETSGGSVDGVALDALSLGALLGLGLSVADVPARSVIADLVAGPDAKGPAYVDPTGPGAYLWHAGRLLSSLSQAWTRRGKADGAPTAAIKALAATDLRLVLSPTDRQRSVAFETLAPSRKDRLVVQLLGALLVAARLVDLPGGDIGDEWPQTLTLETEAAMGAGSPGELVDMLARHVARRTAELD